jgi:hypothetical protein
MSPTGKRICKTTCAAAALFVLIAAFFFYSRYLDLKKTLLDSLSARATFAAGQRVEIGDISLSPSTLVISQIRIENPAGVAPGDLLRIRRLSVGLDLAALVKGKLHIRDIEVYYPKLSIARDPEGRWNISEKLIRLLSEKKKPTFRYHIDEVRIRSGTFEFNGDRRLKNEHIDARLTGLSSEKGTKTIINGSTVFAGNKMDIAAWAYLNDEPKKFMLTVASKAFSLSAFHDLLQWYKVDTGKTKLDFSLTAEGDTGNGFRIRSDITARKTAIPFFGDGTQDVQLMADAFFSPKDSSLTVSSASLDAGKRTTISLKGEVDNIGKAPRYTAEVLVKKVDLSALRFFKGIRMKGIVTSSGIHLRGKAGEGLPEIAGSAVLNDVSFKSPDIELDRMNGELSFSAERGFSAQARTTADIAKAGAFLPAKPALLRLTLSASKKRGGISFTSSATISSFETDMGENQKIRAGSTSLEAAGSLMGKKFSCKGTIEVKDLSYAGHSVPLLRAGSSIDADQHRLLVKDLKIGGRGLTAGAALVELTPDRTGGRYGIKVTGLDAAYPEEKASIEGLDLSLALRREKTFSGDIALSAAKVLFKGIEASKITGRGGFDGKDFHLEVPDADILSGKMRLAAHGKMSGDHLPLSITTAADNVDLQALSTAVSSFVHFPYTLSGRLSHASLEGTIASAGDIRGRASLSAFGVSATAKDPKRILVKKVSVDAAMTFAGQDLSFGLNVAGSVPVKVSGEVKRFTGKERTFAVKVDLAEVKAAAVRESLWDIFPDSLLYTGLAGSLSSRVEISGSGGMLRANGDLTLKDFMLTGENDEYSLGPVNGVVPIGYARPAAQKQAVPLPSFDRSDFQKLKRIYSQRSREPGFSMITIGSIRYGFRLLEDISLLVKQRDGVFTIDSFSANIFGGKLNGSAVITTSGGLGYRGGAMIEGLSLKRVCEDIEPIKGYISGKVDGVMTIKGSGLGLSGLLGKGDFWTYSRGGEKTKISREFLRKIAGPSLKSYMGDRSFDKGVMNFYLQNGFLIFRQLEISNRNFFGMTDLSVKVAPYNNRIAIDQLMWSISEAAQRAKKE